MAQLGFTVVRLGVDLEGARAGYRPDQRPGHLHGGRPRSSGVDQFDATVFDAYMTRLEDTISLLARYGIYSLIDMHQDVYNEAFGGEGAPNWAVCTDGDHPEAPAERARTGASTTPGPEWPRRTTTSGANDVVAATSRENSTRSGRRSPPASGATRG